MLSFTHMKLSYAKIALQPKKCMIKVIIGKIKINICQFYSAFIYQYKAILCQNKFKALRYSLTELELQ
jgi:hypothetical protein